MRWPVTWSSIDPMHTMEPMPEDVELLRLVLARELETINQYETFARTAHSERVRAFFHHLAEEEKEHVAEATLLLQELDRSQKAHFDRADIGIEHFLGGKAATGAEKARAQATEKPGPHWTFTVGSLKRR